MSIWDNIYFWKKKEKPVIVPYRLGYEPIKENDAINMFEDLKPIDLSKITCVDFPETQYFKEEYIKKQIVLHHTVGANAEGTISGWIEDPVRVATCIVIDRDGTPYQTFLSKYWAYHLAAGNHDLDKHSIAIEISNWGWLIPGDNTTKQFGLNQDGTPKYVYTIAGKFYTYYGNSVNVPMEYYPNGFRGYKYYEQYSTAQVRTVGELLLYWRMIYNIPLTYNESMWDVTPSALSGNPGVWTHVSFRPAKEKTDCNPQINLVQMLKTLDGIK
jgi:hypothetical protein